MIDLSIVVPCYNEEANLPELVDRFSRIATADVSLEVIFVDNGSTDGTARVLANLLPRFPAARSVTVPVNQGYGWGILCGLRAAQGDVVGWTHADLQTDPADVVACYRTFRRDLVAGRLVVKGRRVGRPLLDRLFTAGMSVVASAALSARFSDINGQPKVFARTLLETLHDAPWDFSLDLFLLWRARREELAIADYPVRFGERTRGQAKGGGTLRLKWKLTWRTVAFIFELRRRLRRGAVIDARSHS